MNSDTGARSDRRRKYARTRHCLPDSDSPPRRKRATYVTANGNTAFRGRILHTTQAPRKRTTIQLLVAYVHVKQETGQEGAGPSCGRGAPEATARPASPSSPIEQLSGAVVGAVSGSDGPRSRSAAAHALLRPLVDARGKAQADRPHLTCGDRAPVVIQSKLS